MLHLWNHLLQLGRDHGVDPYVFGTLYLAHHPLFWGTMAWLAARVKQKQPVAGVVALGVFFWFMPYAYIVLFGHGLPWWAYAIALLFITVGGAHAYKEIRRRLGRVETMH